MSRSQNKPYWQQLDGSGKPTGESTWAPPGQTVALLSGNIWRPVTEFAGSEELFQAWNSAASSIGAQTLPPASASLPALELRAQIVAAFAAVMQRSMWRPQARAFCIPEPPASLGPFQLLQLKSPSSESDSQGVVSVSVFSFSAAYRRPERYADGLKALADAVSTHLPKWLLRVYVDVSVTCGALLPLLQGSPLYKAQAIHSCLGSCPEAVSAAWSPAWEQLLRLPHVQIVWWEAPALMVPGKTEHKDCAGTFARMLPMVADSKSAHVQPWAAAPAANTPVLCTDADFGAFGQEIGILRMAAWVGAQPPALRPAVVGLSPAGSPADRHQPSLGLPDMLAGSVLTTHRFPSQWLWPYLSAAAAGGVTSLAGQYTAQQQQAEVARGGGAAGRFARCSSAFSYGVDELWMTRIMKGGAVLLDAPSNWWWVQLPNVDRAFGRAVELLGAAVEASPTSAQQPHIAAAAAALATAAGDDSWAAQAASGSGSSDIAARANQQRWTRTVAQRAGLYTRVNAGDARCSVPAFDAAACGEFGKRLLTAMRAVATAAVLGHLSASAGDVQSIMSTVSQLTAALESTGSLVSVAKFTLGGGRIEAHSPPQGAELEASLVECLRSGTAQAVADTPVGGVKRPRS